MLSSPRPRIRKKSSPPLGAILVIALLLVSAYVSHQHRARAEAYQHWLATPIAFKVPSLPKPIVKPLPPLPFPIGEPSGILWNLNNGQLLWSLHPHQVGPLASTTKLMTIYLILHHLPLSQTVVISPTAAGTGGSDMRMAPGQQFTVHQLLYGLMLRSANDTSVALAQALSGHTANFVGLMNQTAKTWGLRGLSFADPDGLSPLSRGTAWDLSVIAMQDLRNPVFRQIVATKLTSLPHNPVVRNLNGLLFQDPSVIGLKTGWTTQAGFNVVFAATRTVHGKPVTLLGIIMHGQQGFPPAYHDAEQILNWGFAQVTTRAENLP
ncbi:MAG: serine hydrolase [Thermaerobacter sp.]|nr:serine hydrolase [Thermaerobacter sp.]